MNEIRLTGKIVEYIKNGELKPVFVASESGGRLSVVDAKGQTGKIAIRKVVIVHAEIYELNRARELAKTIDADLQRLASEVDVEFLWESIVDEGGQYSALELAREYFGDDRPANASAIFRAVLTDSIHFTLDGLKVSPRTREQSEDQRRMIEAREERARVRRQSQEFLREVLDTEEECRVPAGLESIVGRLQQHLFGGESSEVTHWLADLKPDKNVRDLEFLVLERLNQLPEGSDRFLAGAGIDPRFPEAILRAVENIQPFSGCQSRQDLSESGAFSIDDSDTREVDDALTVEMKDDSVTVGIHIADVTEFVRQDDQVFGEAIRRRTSVYLPYRTVYMLPERLCTELVSLRASELRPTLTFLVEFDLDGVVRNWELKPTQVEVKRRLDYEEADRLLDVDGEDCLSRNLAWLDKTARSLEELRLNNGALVLKTPEVKVSVDNGEVDVQVFPTNSASRKIVSEMMILANSLAAQYAFLKGVPLIYRVQGPPKDELELPDQYDPIAYQRIFRALEKSRFSLTRENHSGLGLAGYTQVTSPIRRLGDLVLQQQLSAHVKGLKLPYDQQELLSVLTEAQEGEREARVVERQANRYYLLSYLAQSPPADGVDAIVISNFGSSCVVETTDLFLRGRLSGGKKFSYGEKIRVVVDRVDPEEDVLVFQAV
jgi:exoribonuclease-2